MRIIDSLMEKLLKQHGLTDSQIAELHTQATASKKTLHESVLKNKLISEVDLTKLYAKEIEVPFAEFDPKAIKKEVLNLLPERLARQYRAVVFAADKSMVSVAMEDPDDVQARNFLQQQLGNNIHIHIVPPSVLQAALDQYRGENITSELTKVIPVEEEEEKQEEVDEGAIAEDYPSPRQST
jgi:GSPII_E N-terminal domain.